jgi:cytosine/uracil/thiamine/allantoin permease
MSTLKTAVGTVLRRNGWIAALVAIMNVAHHYWRDGYASPADWFGTMFGVLLVTLLAVLIEAYKLSKKKRTFAQ